MFINMIVVTV